MAFGIARPSMGRGSFSSRGLSGGQATVIQPCTERCSVPATSPAEVAAPRWARALAGHFGYQLHPTADIAAHASQLSDRSGREIALARLQTLIEEFPAPDSRMVVLRIDVDDLDRVNEALSLAAGDLVLEAVATRIIELVGNSANVVRIAGAAFLALVPDADTFGEHAEFAHALRRTVANPVMAMNHVIQPTVSIGVAYADITTNADDVLQNVTLAVRRAKDTGGDRVEFAAADLAREAMERLELEEALRRALATDEIRAWYQPIVDFTNGRVVGYEALSRWITVDGHFVPPSSFIPVAEVASLITEIDILVLAQALSLLVDLPEDQFISVNVSPASLTRADFISRACELIDTSCVNLRRLHLEVTETALPSDLDVIRAAMLRLGMGGAQWYFDDFGTGYSSLTHLGELPVDGIKLDMSFTKGIHSGDETSTRLAHGLLALAKSLDLDTVAEGVESQEVANILGAQGWSHGQGWLYGKAEPIAFSSVAAAASVN